MSLRSAHLAALLCIAVVLNAFPIHAQESDIPSRLTLEDAIRLAIGRNPALSAAKDEVRALEGDKITASKRLNPAVSLEAEDFKISTSPGPFFETQEITLRFDYEIERGGRRRLRTEAAQQAMESQRLIYQDRVRLLTLDVERAFSRAILAKSSLEAAHSLLEETERMISLNRVRFEQGEISALELTRIEVEKLKFQDDVFQADLMLRNAKSSLLALLNAPDLSRDVDVAGALQVTRQASEPGLPPHAPLAELLRMAYERRPDMASRLEQKRRADTETLLQRAIRSPNITVGGGYKRNLTDNTIVYGVTIPLKVFNRNEGEIIRAEAEQMRAVNLAAAVRKEIELEVQQAYNAAEVNRRRVEYIGTQYMKKAEEASRVTLASYKLGGATLLDYLDAQRAYRDTLRIYNQALFDERISLYELASSTGSGVE
jgi:cobalt-zinc-cadmium efflux system outer membrane protein